MIIITGASKNIGRYLFTRFKEKGEQVIGTYNTSTHGLDEDFEFYYKVDVSDYKSVKYWIESIQQKLDNIILINCAAISYNAYAHKADVEKWQEVINTNLLGTYYVIHELLPFMRLQNYGRIINMSSVVAQLPTPGVSAYAASKSAFWGLSKSLAVENGSKGITVNSINLGYVNLGMGINEVPLAYQEKMKAMIPSGKFCNPEEIFSSVMFFIENTYANGDVINLNGGMI
jgi:NAD(P)-dependent dehydrogenase (short-subunit alcohol dehydrogenase family)